MYVTRQRGLGQDDLASGGFTLPSTYSETATFTGLPIAVEMGLAVLGSFVLWSLTKRTGRAARAGAKKHVARLAKAL